MFWARAREVYRGITAGDDDIQRYLRVVGEYQRNSYGGLVGTIQDLGHRWVAAHTPSGPTLEIGAGSGRHSRFFRGRPEDLVVSEYSALQVGAQRDWGRVCSRQVRCDARRLPFTTGIFRSVLSIYNLEHVQEIDLVLAEVHRVLEPGGSFLVALPCEGGFAWNVGREFTTRRQFQKTYGINYDKVIAFEHVRDFAGVNAELCRSTLFDFRRRAFLPFGLPSPHINLIACMEFRACGKLGASA